MSNKLQTAAVHLMSQLFCAYRGGYLDFLDDLAEEYWDDDCSHAKIRVRVTADMGEDLLPKWSTDESIPLNEQHFMEALSKILHPSGVSRGVYRDYFWDILMDNRNAYAWKRLDDVDAIIVLEIVLFGRTLY